MSMKSNKLAGFANNESLVVVHDLEYSFCKKSNRYNLFSSARVHQKPQQGGGKVKHQNI